MTTERFYYRVYNAMNADVVDRSIDKGLSTWEFVLEHGLIRTSNRDRAMYHLKQKYGKDKVFEIYRFNALRSGQVTELP